MMDTPIRNKQLSMAASNIISAQELEIEQLSTKEQCHNDLAQRPREMKMLRIHHRFREKPRKSYDERQCRQSILKFMNSKAILCRT